MNFRMIFKSIGTVICVEAACMIPSLIVALIYNEGDAPAFIVSILAAGITGFVLMCIKSKTSLIYTRDGFAIAALGWLLITAFGALPFILSGAIPSSVDAFFESASGFSTTGASILKDVEAAPKGILFWRSFTHWIGGMGVLILMIALIPSVKPSTLHILKAESPGPSPGKFVPKIGQSTKILYLIYAALTAIQVIILAIGGMPLYDNLVHTFGTAGTGGFSSRNASVGAYGSLYMEIVIAVFMFLFGVNFSLYYMALKGDIKSSLWDEELRFYFTTVVAAIVLITLNIKGTIFPSIGESLRHSSFTVSSIITTTGYTNTDFNLWPWFSKCIIYLLMFMGASAGSTGGGIKCIRILLLFKIAKREIKKITHPRMVQTVKLNGRVVDEAILSGILTFFFLFIAIFALSVLIVSFEGQDFVTTTSAVISCLSNIGPGLGTVGPAGNYSGFTDFSKIILSLDMITGRLEIFPILLLFLPSFWKRSTI
ncbi:MAG TPA: potassium transporter KefA [Clostridiales bacterium]|nr:TrkH family potassium uptake protein [Clostridia bacterium]HCS72717.1 potassium transporter KefA [Clostridiales bacterium]